MNDHILVIDDSPDDLKLVLRFLSAKGYSVNGALSTREADGAIAQVSPALVIVDISLPGEDGLSWVRRTRASLASPPRFVALTAHCSPEAQERALAAGCHAFAVKPTPLKELLELVRAQMGAS